MMKVVLFSWSYSGANYWIFLHFCRVGHIFRFFEPPVFGAISFYVLDSYYFESPPLVNDQCSILVAPVSNTPVGVP